VQGVRHRDLIDQPAGHEQLLLGVGLCEAMRTAEGGK
jgi:hypothetical protein